MSGFCKKVLIADTVGILTGLLFKLDQPGFLEAWLGMLSYTIQLYFDFNGYSDMALGLGLMLGFHFPENFDRPYTAASITEFWQRWHISLSGWLRDYLYIPLGGNRKGLRRTYINLALVMLIGGLWHGAAWTFIAWGCWHGGWLVLERYLTARQIKWSLPRPAARFVTLLLVMFGWLIFRARHGGQVLAFFAGLAGLQGWGFSDVISWQISSLSLLALGLGWLCVICEGRTGGHNKTLIPWCGLAANRQLLVLPFFILGLLKLMAESFSPFLYFQF
jgi:alginate O-acetyltransferase complex protein AlgI